MPNLYLGPGTYRFERVVIERLIQPWFSGSYALGIKDEKGEFIPKHIGRSDTDLRQELINNIETLKYPYFKFSVTSPRAAYELECAQYHGFRAQLDDQRHPVGPAESGLKCFLCGL